jgi:hypothetical protein
VYVKEPVMKTWFYAAVLACFSVATTAESVHVVQIVNDTGSRILSFAVAPVNSQRWTEVHFGYNPAFDNGWAFKVELRGGEGCLRDFRTMLSDGRRIVAHHIDVCRLHTYRPSVRYDWDSTSAGSEDRV